jgi:hypothetical protein
MRLARAGLNLLIRCDLQPRALPVHVSADLLQFWSTVSSDLVWIRVGANTSTTIAAEGYCYNKSRSWPGAASYNTIHATRTGQTWWVGPKGVRHN